MNTEEYLTTLTQQIRCKAARDSVSEEIRQHIEDQIEAYLSCGTSPEEAEKLAIADMGDPIETGAALDQIHRPKMAWPLLLGLVAFSLIGLLVQQYLSVRFPENFSPLIPSRIAGSLLFLLFAMTEPLSCFMYLRNFLEDRRSSYFFRQCISNQHQNYADD